MRFRSYARLTLGINLFVIAWGALVRATGSGAGCGRHWPLCNGQAVPQNPATATMIEYTHRVTSAAALVAVLGLVWWSRRAFERGHPVRRWSWISLGFIIVEALVGAGLVLLELVGTNDSALRAGYLAIHLLNTFLLLAALTITALVGTEPAPAKRQPTGSERIVVWVGLIGLLVVGMTGAVTALGDTLFPSSSLAEGLRQDVSATAHFLIRLRVIHPALAVVVGITAIVGAWWVTRGGAESGAIRGWAQAVTALALTQLAAGTLNLLLLAPLPMQLVHLVLADAVWMAQVGLATRLWWTEGSEGVVRRSWPDRASSKGVRVKEPVG
jgi:heme A synthase